MLSYNHLKVLNIKSVCILPIPIHSSIFKYGTLQIILNYHLKRFRFDALCLTLYITGFIIPNTAKNCDITNYCEFQSQNASLSLSIIITENTLYFCLVYLGDLNVYLELAHSRVCYEQDSTLSLVLHYFHWA